MLYSVIKFLCCQSIRSVSTNIKYQGRFLYICLESIWLRKIKCKISFFYFFENFWFLRFLTHLKLCRIFVKAGLRIYMRRSNWVSVNLFVCLVFSRSLVFNQPHWLISILRRYWQASSFSCETQKVLDMLLLFLKFLLF